MENHQLENLKQSLHEIISDYPDVKISIVLYHWQTDFLRFFKSQTNYNISKNHLGTEVQLYKDKKNYSFTVNNPTSELVRNSIDEALKVIDKLPPDPHFVDLETQTEKGLEASKPNPIELISLEKKIEILNDIKSVISPLDFDLYGTFICNYEKYYLMNSNGLDKKWESSPYYLEIKAVSNKNEVTVLSCNGGENFSDSDITILKTDLLEKCKQSLTEVIDLPSGNYEVILAPRCIGDFLAYYKYSNLRVSSVDRQETELEGKIGEQVFPEFFSLYDSPQHRHVVTSDYGSNGRLIKELPLFEKGVFKNFLVDFYYGNKLNYEINGNTGSCLVMSTGDTKLEDMIKGVKKGLYISSFHYMNFINPRETSITGLTRDGTFLIEDGKITKVVNNLRFTEKITDVIRNIESIEDKASVFPMSDNYGTFSISAYSMPHVKIKQFYISSSTKTV